MKSFGLVGTIALLTVLSGCGSSATVTDPNTTREAAGQDDRVRGCLTNSTEGNISYSFLNDPRQADGTPLPDREPEQRGILGPGATACAYSSTSYRKTYFFAEVVLGSGQGFDTFMFQNMGDGTLRALCAIGDDGETWTAGGLLNNGSPKQFNCGIPAAYPTIAYTDGKVTSVSGISTRSIQWRVLPQP